MIWRLILAVVLLGVVVGGIVGFNLFRDKMIAGFFAGMQPPPVAVSVIEVEPITWQPGIEAIGTARAAQGVELAVETGGIVEEILLQGQRPGRGRPAARADRRRDRARRPRRRAGRRWSSAETSWSARRSCASAASPRSTTSTSAQADASRAPGPGGQADRGDGAEGLEAPFAGIIGIPQVDVGAVCRCRARSTRRCRTSTPCGSTSRCPSSRSG